MLHGSGARVIFDAYNANPASMRAAVEAFCQEFSTRPKILVLGDMKELGARSAEYHGELGRWLATLPLQAVYLAGPEMRAAAAELAAAAPGFPVRHGLAPEEWLDDLRQDCREGRAIFFKASRSMRFEDISRALGMS